MKKIEFIKNVLGATLIESNDCGQSYYFVADWGRGNVWVDTLKGGRVSIKVKHFRMKEAAEYVATKLYNNLLNMSGSVVDAATKADTYKGFCARYSCGYVARLRCDKHWN